MASGTCADWPGFVKEDSFCYVSFCSGGSKGRDFNNFLRVLWLPEPRALPHNYESRFLSSVVVSLQKSLAPRRDMTSTSSLRLHLLTRMCPDIPSYQVYHGYKFTFLVPIRCCYASAFSLTGWHCILTSSDFVHQYCYSVPVVNNFPSPFQLSVALNSLTLVLCFLSVMLKF